MDDAEKLPNAPCPLCGTEIPQLLRRCPQCGGDLVRATRPRFGPFEQVMIGLCVAAVVLPILYLLIRSHVLS